MPGIQGWRQSQLEGVQLVKGVQREDDQCQRLPGPPEEFIQHCQLDFKDILGSKEEIQDNREQG